jgi:hypothetical protein
MDDDRTGLIPIRKFTGYIKKEKKYLIYQTDIILNEEHESFFEKTKDICVRGHSDDHWFHCTIEGNTASEVLRKEHQLQSLFPNSFENDFGIFYGEKKINRSLLEKKAKLEAKKKGVK